MIGSKEVLPENAPHRSYHSLGSETRQDCVGTPKAAAAAVTEGGWEATPMHAAIVGDEVRPALLAERPLSFVEVAGARGNRVLVEEMPLLLPDERPVPIRCIIFSISCRACRTCDRR